MFAGDLCPRAPRRLRVREARRDAAGAALFDVVLTTNSGYPLDQNLYQAVKGMSAAYQVVKPGGPIVCAAECCDGFPAHGSYGEVLASQPSPEKLLAMINAPGYSTPDQWQVQVQYNIQDHARVVVHTGHLSDDELRAVHLEQTHDITQTVADEGDQATICVLPEGPQTIAYVDAPQ